MISNNILSTFITGVMSFDNIWPLNYTTGLKQDPFDNKTLPYDKLCYREEYEVL